MTIGLLKDIITSVPPNVRLLGMDVGTKTIGLAMSDPAHNIATPLKTISRTKLSKDAIELAKIVKDYEIGGFIIGLPLNTDGSEGPRCQSVRDFAAELAKYPEVVGKSPWIAFWDERFSTASVEDFVDNSLDIKKRKAKETGLIDKLAAQSILQGALDFIVAIIRHIQ